MCSAHTDDIRHESANYSLWAKAGLVLFYKIKISQNTATFICLHTVRGYFPATLPEVVSSFNGDLTSSKLNVFSMQTFTEKVCQPWYKIPDMDR